jgi:citrate synthase
MSARGRRLAATPGGEREGGVEAPIAIAGHDVVDLIGSTSLTEAFLLGIDEALPDAGKTRVVDAVLVAMVEHGITPSSLATRLVLDGAPEALSGAVAAGLLAVGSRFLGTIEDAAALLERIVERAGPSGSLAGACDEEATRILDAGERIPGVGHNLHRSVDPRVAALLEVARREGLDGRHAEAFELLPSAIERRLGRRLVPNAAGAIAAVLADLGYRAAEVRGFALLARCAGLFAHALDERKHPRARAIWEAANRGDEELG